MQAAAPLVLAVSVALGQAEEASPHYEHLKFMESEIGSWVTTEWEYHPYPIDGVDQPVETYRLEEGQAPEYGYEFKWVGNKAWIQETPFHDREALHLIGWDVATRQVANWRFNPNGSRKVNYLIKADDEQILWDDHWYGIEGSTAPIHFGGKVRIKKLGDDLREFTLNDKNGRLVLRTKSRRED